MAHKAPGKAYREGITLLQLADLFPTEESAVNWFERVVWTDERACGHCGSLDTHRIKSGKLEWSWPRAVDSYGLEIQAAGAYLLS